MQVPDEKTDGGASQVPFITMPGYSVYRDQLNPSRFVVRAEATGKTARISKDIVVKLAVSAGAVHQPGLPRNTHIDQKIERLRQDKPWEAEYSAAAILSVHEVAYKLMPETFPVPMEAYNRASREAYEAHLALIQKQTLADAAWADVMAAAAALPQFAHVQELSECRGLVCLESPLGVCLYDAVEDPWQDQCLVCGLPKDRG